MTHTQAPDAQPGADAAAPPDALLAHYHAAQAALDAKPDESGTGAVDPSMPNAQVRANILAHAARLAQTPGAVAVTNDAINSGAAYAYIKKARGQLDQKLEAANDGQWKVRALASVAVLGLTGLLFMQWDRSSPQEKEVALSMERTAPVVPAAPPTSAPPVAAAPATPSVAAPPAKAVPLPAPSATPPVVAPPPVSAQARSADTSAKRAVQTRQPEPVPAIAAETAPSVQVVPASVAPAPVAVAAVAPTPVAVAPIAPAPAPAPPTPPAPALAAAPNSAATSGIAAPPRPAAATAAAGVAARTQGSKALSADAAGADSAMEAAASAAPPSRQEAAPARLMSPNAALFAAIREADAASLQIALARGADKNAKSNGTPAVTLCVLANQPALLRQLAAAGADLNAPDAQGLSPLAHAQANNLQSMQLLLNELGVR